MPAQTRRSVHLQYMGLWSAFDRGTCTPASGFPRPGTSAHDSEPNGIPGPNGALETTPNPRPALPPVHLATAKGTAGLARACPACGHMVDHRLRFRANSCDILQCSSCGLGRAETPGFDPA